MSPTSPSTRALRPSLTGARVVAACVVFGVHVSYPVGTTPLRHLHHVMSQGNIGVDFFFVLSGFILAWVRRPRDSVRSYYRRRVARIFPNHLVMWAITFTVLACWATRPTLSDALPALLLLQAWTPHRNVIFAVDGVTWTLSCELFFYAVLPVLLTVLLRCSDRLRVGLLAGSVALYAAIGVVAAAMPSSQVEGSKAFWLINVFPPTRLIEFVIGVLAALVAGVWQPTLRVGPIAASALVLYVLAGWWDPLFSHLIVPVLALLIVALALADDSGRQSVLANRWTVMFGTWTFAFYLVHAVVILGLGGLGWNPVGLVDGLAFVAVSFAGSVAAAGLLFTLIERPAEARLRHGGARADAAQLHPVSVPALPVPATDEQGGVHEHTLPDLSVQHR